MIILYGVANFADMIANIFYYIFLDINILLHLMLKYVITIISFNTKYYVYKKNIFILKKKRNIKIGFI